MQSEAQKANQARYRATEKGKASQRRKEARCRVSEKGKAERWRHHLRYRYNITPEFYDEMFRRQGGLCAICETPLTPRLGSRVDHNHETGLVRGILCDLCNQGLGRFNDDIRRLEAAVEYLRKAEI